MSNVIRIEFGFGIDVVASLHMNLGVATETGLYLVGIWDIGKTRLDEIGFESHGKGWTRADKGHIAF